MEDLLSGPTWTQEVFKNYHCCPVNLSLALRARISAGKRKCMVSSAWNWMEHFSEFLRGLDAHEHKTLFGSALLPSCHGLTFTRIAVDRYGGDHRVRTLESAPSWDRSMAFAQLTYRESKRDIETCLSVHASKLYPWASASRWRSTLADANERRDWRIHAALAQRPHHPGEDAVRRRRTGVGPDQYRQTPWTRGRPSL